ncbi:type II toxin-antitoxin system HicA family toxin [Methylocaldum gracile subsp. desertum]|uniref:type II toxin-antitoxin system HicA family toxin n=1 Tax=Methylocaldum sp. GT1BW TaxID=3438964 RepID=UPI003DA013B5
MKTISGKALGKLPERHGRELKRIDGSHHVYGKQGYSARISIPVHGNDPLKIGLLKHFLKVAEISEHEL